MSDGTILMLAHDPGGANAVAAVAAALCRKGFPVELYGHGPALQRYRLMGLEGRRLDQTGADDVHDLLEMEHPDLVITGTSGDDFSERHMWAAARQCGIPTIAIMDQWINFGLRFSPYGLADRDRYLAHPEHPYQPDYVMVMDAEAREEMIRDGLPAERVIISGQPYFDILASRREEYTPEKVAVLRAAHRLEPGEKAIVYISESIRQDYRVAEGGEPYWGYDEISIFQELLAGLQPLLDRGRRFRLLVKQHPLERDDLYSELAPGLEARYPGMKIEVVQDRDPHDLLMIADLVCGMSSMLLFEALLLERPVMSIQIGLCRENPLLLDSKGILKSILRREDLPPALARALENEPAGNGSALAESGWHYHPGAIGVICEFVEGLLCRN